MERERGKQEAGEWKKPKTRPPYLWQRVQCRHVIVQQRQAGKALAQDLEVKKAGR